ncbi:HAMP domain-containing protein [Cohnella rhizosphaerae]|uniref:histidine kinase n=1 Tax=Cohnella rhizosphaerae TaxID=1457232 RepID=A0A9X4QV34_9BACL|nr:HAMP domain-containing protein [Cohnella rhizosphaerae]MDG0811122.1 HAMP domain-containing protein [Cohnella rhizosphaerae]
MSSLRMQTKLFFNYSIVVLAVIVAAFGFFYSYMARSLEQNAIDNLQQIALKTSEQLDGFLSELDHLALQTVTNKVVQNAFIHADQADASDSGNYFDRHLEDRHQVMDMLASINGPNLTAMRFSLYNAKGDYINYGTSPVDESVVAARMASPQFAEDYAALLHYDGNRMIAPPHPDYWSDQGTEIVSIYREIRDVYESYGMLEIQQPYGKLERIVQLSTLPEVRVFVYDDKRHIVYGKGEPEQIDSMIDSMAVGHRKVNDEIAAAAESAYSGWTVMLLDTSGSLLPGILILRKTLVVIGIGLMAITLLIIYLITRQLTRPLKQLTSSVKKVGLHNLSIDLANDRKSNEIVQLNRAFDKMFDRLKHSMNQVVESRSQELNAQFRALQSQLNPHFLYNVLSVIGAAGLEAGGAEDHGHLLQAVRDAALHYDLPGARRHDPRRGRVRGALFGAYEGTVSGSSDVQLGCKARGAGDSDTQADASAARGKLLSACVRDDRAALADRGESVAGRVALAYAGQGQRKRLRPRDACPLAAQNRAVLWRRLCRLVGVEARRARAASHDRAA